MHVCTHTVTECLQVRATGVAGVCVRGTVCGCELPVQGCITTPPLRPNREERIGTGYTALLNDQREKMCALGVGGGGDLPRLCAERRRERARAVYYKHYRGEGCCHDGSCYSTVEPSHKAGRETATVTKLL